jgi:hypothetical protein
LRELATWCGSRPKLRSDWQMAKEMKEMKEMKEEGWAQL